MMGFSLLRGLPFLMVLGLLTSFASPAYSQASLQREGRVIAGDGNLDAIIELQFSDEGTTIHRLQTGFGADNDYERDFEVGVPVQVSYWVMPVDRKLNFGDCDDFVTSHDEPNQTFIINPTTSGDRVNCQIDFYSVGELIVTYEGSRIDQDGEIVTSLSEGQQERPISFHVNAIEIDDFVFTGDLGFQVSSNGPGGEVIDVTGPTEGGMFEGQATFGAGDFSGMFPAGRTTVEITVRDNLGIVAFQAFDVEVREDTVTPRELTVTPRELTVTPRVGGVTSMTFEVAGENLPAGSQVVFVSEEISLSGLVAVGQSRTTSLQPGSYLVRYQESDGLIVMNSVCPGASVDLSRKELRFTLAVDQQLTCRLVSRLQGDEIGDRMREISNFLEVRSQVIIAHQPSVGRRLARLRGGPSRGSLGDGSFGGGQGGQISFDGQQLSIKGLPIDVRVTRQKTHIRGSLSQARQAGDLSLLLGESNLEILNSLLVMGLRMGNFELPHKWGSGASVTRNQGRSLDQSMMESLALETFGVERGRRYRATDGEIPGQNVSSMLPSLDQILDMGGHLLGFAAGRETGKTDHPQAGSSLQAGSLQAGFSPTGTGSPGSSGLGSSGAKPPTSGGEPLASLSLGATSLGGMNSEFSPGEPVWDAWFDFSFGRYGVAEDDGVFGVLNIGGDRRFGDDLLLGVSAQIDHVEGHFEENTRNLARNLEGVGWMAGPYMTYRLYGDLLLDTAVGYGRSENEIETVSGHHPDDFSSQRVYARLQLLGDFVFAEGSLYGRSAGPGSEGDKDVLWSFQPAIQASRYIENADSYVDRLGLRIDKTQTRSGELSSGGKITRSTALHSQYVSAEAIWTFEVAGNSKTLSGDQQRGLDEGWRGRVGGGTSFGDVWGGNLGFDIRYDGLGSSRLEVLTINMGYSLSFP